MNGENKRVSLTGRKCGENLNRDEICKTGSVFDKIRTGLTFIGEFVQFVHKKLWKVVSQQRFVQGRQQRSGMFLARNVNSERR